MLTNNQTSLKLCDIGLAKNERDITSLKSAVTMGRQGTPEYMAPECFGRMKVPRGLLSRSDTYSFAITALDVCLKRGSCGKYPLFDYHVNDLVHYSTLLQLDVL